MLCIYIYIYIYIWRGLICSLTWTSLLANHTHIGKILPNLSKSHQIWLKISTSQKHVVFDFGFSPKGSGRLAPKLGTISIGAIISIGAGTPSEPPKHIQRLTNPSKNSTTTSRGRPNHVQRFIWLICRVRRKGFGHISYTETNENLPYIYIYIYICIHIYS